jgi:ferredoxin
MPETPSSAPAPARRSRTIAKIWPERCTGCEACIAVAPWDACIVKEGTDLNVPTGMVVCDVDADKCTGCTLCMKICPWDAIEMIPRPGQPAVSRPAAKA